MRFTTYSVTVAASLISTVSATASLSQVCTTAYAKAHLPTNPFGITIDPNSIQVSAVQNYTAADSTNYPGGSFDYCNVTLAYSHNGLNDSVLLTYWMPAPAAFKKRYLSTGGGGLAINSGASSLAGGLLYGAVAGETDGGFGSFSTQFDAVFLLANGTVNWNSVYMFGYKAHYELAEIGKAFTKVFYNMTSSQKLYSYYQACSEGGREGFSQVQRYGGEFDGAIIGAPAFRYSFQQANHLYSNLVEKDVGYYPPSCEFEKIVNLTIAACDPLDGKTDGVVSRSDLCKLHVNWDSFVGQEYYCAASTGGGNGPFKRAVSSTISRAGGSLPTSSTGSTTGQATGTTGGAGGAGGAGGGMGGFGGGTTTPAQNGTVTKKGVEVVRLISRGLQDLTGKQVYLSYQPATSIVDGATTYNATSKTWGLDISGLGGEWIVRFLNLIDSSTLSNLDGWTYNTLRDYMIQGLEMYSDSLQTDWPDLTTFQKSGGKILHYHGESDNSIPTASSVRYYESVRQIMYPGESFSASTECLQEWYRLFLVPGAAHCGPNTLQPNGPFPQTNLQVMIEWVENGVVPKTLNATVLQGQYKGKNEQICAWPQRPLWKNGVMSCVFDQTSYNSWQYKLDGIKVPVY